MPQDNLRAQLRIRSETRQARRGLRDVERSLDRVDDRAKRTSRSFRLLRGAAIGFAAGTLLRSIGRIGIEYERLRLNVRLLSPDVQTASRRFKELNQFAARTPFALADIVEQFTGLQALNVTPTIQQMESLANIAAFVRGGFDQLGTAIRSAISGEFEPLRRAGIIFRKEGNTIRATYRGVTEEINNTAEAIVDYLARLGQTGQFAGAAEQQSRTLGGALSTLRDNLEQVANAFIEGALIEFLTDFTMSTTDSTAALKEFASEAGNVTAQALRITSQAFSLLNSDLGRTLITLTAFTLGAKVAIGAIRGLTTVIVSSYRSIGTAALGAQAAHGNLIKTLLRSPGAVFVAGAVLYVIWEAYRFITREQRLAQKQHDEFVSGIEDLSALSVHFTLVRREGEITELRRELNEVIDEIERLEAIDTRLGFLGINAQTDAQIKALQRERSELEAVIILKEKEAQLLRERREDLIALNNIPSPEEPEDATTGISTRAERARQAQQALDKELLEDRRAANEAIEDEEERSAERRRQLHENLNKEFREDAERSALLQQNLSNALAAQEIANLRARQEAYQEWVQTIQGQIATYVGYQLDTSRSIADIWINGFQSAEDALVEFVRTGKLSFADLVDTLIADFARLAIRAAILQPLFQSLGGLFGFNFQAPVAHGGLRPGETSTGVTRTVDPIIFYNAPRLHQGLGPDEFPAILQRGEQVIPRGESAGFGGNVTVQLVNQSSAELDVQQGESRISADALVQTIILRDLSNNGSITQGFRGANRAGLFR